MDKVLKMESFINMWNGLFPTFTLKAEDLKKPHAVTGALLQLFDRLGIDRDAVLSPPGEENLNDSLPYYRDLLPVINITRVTKYIALNMPQVEGNYNTSMFLQPTSNVSHSLLLMLLNFLSFNEERLQGIAPYEEAFFSKANEVKVFEDKVNKLLVMLNEQAQEKAKRSQRMKTINRDIEQIDEDMAKEEQLYHEEKHELEALLKEKHQAEIIVEQKKSQKESLMVEIERLKGLRVYDADDIKAQTEQMAVYVQETEEKLTSLEAMLFEKETRLKNLQMIKLSLDSANTQLHEILKLSESMKELESGDLDSESMEGELEVLNMELKELNSQLSELRAARDELSDRCHEEHILRQRERTQLVSVAQEEEEKARKRREECKKYAKIIDEIKQRTLQYNEEKTSGVEKLNVIRDTYNNQIKSYEEMLLMKLSAMMKKMSE